MIVQITIDDETNTQLSITAQFSEKVCLNEPPDSLAGIVAAVMLGAAKELLEDASPVGQCNTSMYDKNRVH